MLTVCAIANVRVGVLSKKDEKKSGKNKDIKKDKAKDEKKRRKEEEKERERKVLLTSSHIENS